MGKLFKLFIVLLVIVVGGLYGHYRYILKTDIENAPPSFWAYLRGLFETGKVEVVEELQRGREIESTTSSSEEEKEKRLFPIPKKEEPEKRIVKTPKPEVREVAPPKPKVDWKAVERLRDEANKAYEAAEFDIAYNNLKRIKEILREGGETSSTLYDWADRYSKRAWVFSALLSHIKRSELATGKDIYILKLETGADLWVRVIKEDEDGVWFEKEGGIESMVPRDNIVEMVEKSPQEYKDYLRAKFEDRKRLLSRFDYIGMFIKLVVFAKRYGLDEKITPLLEKIFEQPGSENIVQMFVLKGDPDEYVVALLEGFGRDAEARRYRERSRRFAWRQPPRSEELPLPVRKSGEETPGKTTSETGGGPEPSDREPVERQVQPTETSEHLSEPVSSGLEKLSASERMQFEELRRLMNEGRQKMNAAILTEGNRRFNLGREADKAVTKALKIVRDLRDAHNDIIELEMMEQQLSEMKQTIMKHLLPAR